MGRRLLTGVGVGSTAYSDQYAGDSLRACARVRD